MTSARLIVDGSYATSIAYSLHMKIDYPLLLSYLEHTFACHIDDRVLVDYFPPGDAAQRRKSYFELSGFQVEECGLKREIRRDVMTSQMCTVDVQKGADVLIACYLMRWMSYPDSDLLFFFGGDGDFYPLFKFNKLFFGKRLVLLHGNCSVSPTLFGYAYDRVVIESIADRICSIEDLGRADRVSDSIESETRCRLFLKNVPVNLCITDLCEEISRRIHIDESEIDFRDIDIRPIKKKYALVSFSVRSKDIGENIIACFDHAILHGRKIDVSYFRSRNVHSSVESQPEDPGSEPWITMLPTSKRCEDMTQELVASSDQLQERPHTFFAEDSSPTSLSTPCSSPHPLMDCFSSHSNSDSMRWQSSDEENENRRTLEMSDIFSEDAVQTIVEYDIP